MTDYEEPLEIGDDDITPVIPSTHLSSAMRLTRKELISKRTSMRNAIGRAVRRSDQLARDQARAILSGPDYYSTKLRQAEEANYGLVYAVTNLTDKVVGSLGVVAPVEVSVTTSRMEPMVIGSTDFETIGLTVNASKIDIKDPDNVIKLVNMIKGIVYHETAHLIWSTHPRKMLRFGLEETRKHSGAGGDGDPRAVAREVMDKYGTPDTLAKYVKECMASDRQEKALLYKAWNILEDQRVDTAMCTVSPRMGRYFTECVMELNFDAKHPGAGWPHIIGRTYVPQALRDLIRTDAMKHRFAAMLPEMEEIVLEYRKCNDLLTMYNLVLRMAPMLFLWDCDETRNPNGPGRGLDNHNPHTHIVEGDKQDVPHPESEPAQPESEPQTDKTADNRPSESTKDDPQEGQATGSDNSDAEQNQTKTPSRGVGTSKDEVTKVIDEYRKNVPHSTASEAEQFAAMVTEINSAKVKPEKTRAMTDEMISDTIKIAGQIRDSLEMIVRDTDPVWQFHQDSGVLDPSAFLTRARGEEDYWSGFDHYGNPGHDLAVSILLDTSGSMYDSVSTLSVCSMGIRKACEHLNIPCTLTTFSDMVRMYADAETKEAPFEQVLCNGNTYIMEALSCIRDQRYGKSQHLVIILTDGEWSDVSDIRPWVDPGSRFIGVAYNTPKGFLTKKGFNSVVEINNLDSFPRLVTQEIATYFG